MAYSESSIADFFQQQSIKTPQAIAVSTSSDSLSYQQLDEQSNRYARHLQQQNISAGSRVCICVERGLHLAQSLLSTIKTGAAYIPLDPSYPIERLNYMLQDSQPDLILCSQEHAHLFSNTSTPVSIFNLADADNCTAEPIAITLIQKSLAYIIYTSGSTGKPKGVALSQQALINLIDWQVQQPGFSSPAKVLQFSPLSFDVHFQEFFSTWASGGELVMIDDDVRRDAVQLLQFIKQHNIQRLFQPFISLQQLSEAALHYGLPTSLEHIVTAGEQLQISPSLEKFFTQLPACQLHNHYGPSETHVVSSYTLKGTPQEWPRFPPIGKAINGAHLLIVDDELKIITDDKPGELLISGICLAEGYWQQETRTKERFIDLALEKQTLAAFRSGDLVQRDENGDFIYLGRIDEQVKIRGYRIELGEIEHHIRQQNGIKDCAVVALKNQTQQQLAAYLQINADNEAITPRSFNQTVQQIRAKLADNLPEYMLPARYQLIQSMPLTPSGKLDKKNLPPLSKDRPELEQELVTPNNDCELKIAQIWQQLLEIDEVGIHDNFFDLGGSSLLSLQLRLAIKEEMQHELDISDVFQYPNIASLARFISQSNDADNESDANTNKPQPLSSSTSNSQGIAIIGMSCRFPGAESLAEFWQNLSQGKESIHHFSTDEMRAAGIDESLMSQDNYVAARGIINSPEDFDAAFFGIAPHEAELIDPQQRLFLETCWHALESSGYGPGTFDVPVGVWGGVSTGMSNNTYLQSNINQSSQALAREDAISAMLGNSSGYVTTRVSYKLDLKGPSVNVQTACSTSMVAIAEACQSLENNRCDMALAGGVSISFPQQEGYLFQEGDIGSPDAHCRPFDAKAQGTVFSNGVGVITLKRVDEAVADGDTIYAVIRSSAINNDGANKVSFAAPSVDSQAAVIAQAHALAGIDAASINYVEAHGTATPLGDPIEVAGLSKAFGKSLAGNNCCALGSVKSNFGHLEAAAGVAAVIKTALCLQHKKLVPTLHYTEANPNIDFSSTPFYVNDKYCDWKKGSQPRRAGVSGFGLGGTNAHLILEEAPASSQASASNAQDLLLLSAKSAKALRQLSEDMGQFIAANPAIAISDIAFTLRHGRKAFRHRLVAVSEDRDKMATALSQFDRTAFYLHQASQTPTSIVFMFPGGGSQYHNMGLGLYQNNAFIKEKIDQGLAIYQQETAIDLKSIWFCADNTKTHAQTQLQRPSIQLAAIFILEMAVAEYFQSIGIQADALIGHSLGENTAACLAGVFSYSDALRLVILRGQLFETIAPGAMLSVTASAQQLQPYLNDQLDLATINAAEQCTVSGEAQAINTLLETLKSQDIDAQRIPINIAAHSHMLDPILAPFGNFLRSIELHAPNIPMISNHDGQWLTDEQACNPDYWVNHLRHTVLFSQGIETLNKTSGRIYLELGPGKILSSLAKMDNKTDANNCINCIRHEKEALSDTTMLEAAIGRLWAVGIPINWQLALPNAIGKRVPVPGYPFQRKRFFLESARALSQQNNSLQKTENIAVSQTIPSTLDQPTRKLQVSTVDRHSYILSRLRDIIHELSGMDEDDIENDISFLDMGFDSLFLTQVNLRFKKAFAVKLSFRQLFDEAPCLTALADYIHKSLPADALKEELQNLSETVAEAPATSNTIANVIPTLAVANNNSDLSSLQQALQLQVQASNALLQAVQTSSLTATQASPKQQGNQPTASNNDKLTQLDASRFQSLPPSHGRIGPYKPLNKNISADLNAQQQDYLQQFMLDYQQRTKGSKALTAEHREHFADPRAMGGFKTIWKEICYPIAAQRSKNARMWDIDGNEYVDCVGGFGAGFFGQGPDFLLDVLHQQLDKSIDYGPQSLLAGKIAKQICEFTGMERASFCNTGSEAVLAAMRIARTTTGNDLIATFTGDYHGIFDEVLVKAQVIGDKRCNRPIAPGIPASACENMLVLEYGDPASIEIIKERAHELAGVLVEPIQSRMPELQPKAFLKALRAVTKECDVPLIFDEIITGFRLHNKGAQAWFDVDVDIAAYGKVIGAGMPIGVVAGKSRYMDALDGGMWQYGDDSFPEAGVTYFAGTFVRHPLALAAVEAVLNRLEKEGPALQQMCSRNAAVLCEKISLAYHSLNIPIELVYFGTVILPRYRGNPDFEGLFFYHLRYFGAHIWEGRPGFLTTEHGPAEMQQLEQAFIKAAVTMQENGFFNDVSISTEEHRFTRSQSEMWLACKMGDNASCAYNEQVLFSINNSFDFEVLELALNKAANHHPSLRAIVNEDESGLIIQAYVSPQIKHIDLSHLSVAEQQVEIQNLAKKQLGTAFDFKKGPLIKALLIELSAQSYYLCVCTSHLVCDGWSLEIVMLDIAKYYTSIKQARHAEPSPTPSLADFIALKQESVACEEYQQAQSYWLDQYKTIPEDLHLPSDHTRPTIRSFTGERHSCYLPESLMTPLHEQAKTLGCTSFVLMLAAYEILLHKLSGQNDIVVGIPAAGQPLIGMPDLVAHDVDFLPLRMPIDNKQSFKGFLKDLQNTFMDAKSHQEFSYGQLLPCLKITRDPGRLPLVSTSFNMDKAFSSLDFDGVEAQFISSPRAQVKYDLLFNLTDEGDRVLLEVDRYAGLYNASTIQRWIQHYQFILEQILAGDNRLIEEFSLSDTALLTNLQQWNNNSKNYGLETLTLAHLLNAGLQKNPTKNALTFENAYLSYKDLDIKSNQVAHYLQSLHCQSDDCIAVLMDRSLEMVIALCGIIKAGYAYLPLDPKQPQERLHSLLANSNAKVLISQQAFQAVLPSDTPQLVLDSSCSALEGQNTSPVDSKATPDSLAYIIYTSGSTGMPKGVMNHHKGICNRLLWMQEAIPITEDDNVLQKTPYTFDVSVWEFFLPLISGAHLVIAKPEGHKDSEYLSDLIIAEKITYLHFVPSMLSIFLASPSAEKVSGLKHVICSGEVLKPSVQNAFFDTFQHTELYNLYGPTEAAVDVSFWQCNRQTQQNTIPIGRPIANTQLYLLDDNLKPVAIGVEAELYIGGVQVARGYLNDPSRTQQQFISNPFSTAADSKLYKTGDIARINEEGVIEYIGRNDFQVKLRGQRIELSEIELCAETLAEIRQCIAMVREDNVDDQRLVIYISHNIEVVQIKDNFEADIEQLLKQHLQQHLPDYMQPQHIVHLQEFPLTSSGKIDRKQLPAVELTITQDQFIAASTPTEITVHALWCEILGLETISADSNFFELGGHSLLGTKLFAKIRSHFSINLSLSTLFSASTIQRLAAVIDENLQTPSEFESNNIAKVDNSITATATSQQARLWYLHEINPQQNAFNLPTAFRLKGALQTQLLQKALTTIVQRHDILRSNIIMHQGKLLLRTHEHMPIDLSPIEYPISNGIDSLVQLLKEDAARAFDLANDELIRFRLYRLGKDDHVFYMVPHHTIFDGWSYDIFIKEITTLYNAYLAGTEANLAQLPIQYHDYAIWQERSKQEHVDTTQLDYWLEHLSGELPILDMPLDYPRVQQQDNQAQSIHFHFDEKIVSALESRCTQQGCTLFMLLLSCFSLTLHRYSRQKDILIGTPISGRNFEEISNLLGFFVNTLVMRLKIDDQDNLPHFLQQVKETCLQAFKHQDLQFEELVQHLKLDRDETRSPVFQAFMIFQDTRNRTEEFDGIEKQQLMIDRKGVQTDIDLWLKRESTGLMGAFEYPSHLFNTNSMQAVVDYFTGLINQLASNETFTLQQLLTVTPQEQKRMQRWNSNQSPRIDSDVARQVLPLQLSLIAKQQADNIAVICNGASLSYIELEARSNQLAHYLTKQGVKGSSLVGICMPRTINMMVALFGIMKSGAAYVPMDPEYPAARLQHMIAASQLNTVVTESQWQSLFSQEINCLLMNDETQQNNISNESTQLPTTLPEPQQLAYVIFTSGSTGKPKGVKVKHAGVSNFLSSMQKEPGMKAENTLLAVTTLSFDIAVLELYLPLLVGAKVVIASQEDCSDGRKIAQLLDFYHIDIMQATPITWRMLLEAGWQGNNSFTALIGGEKLPQDLVHKLLESSVKLWNMFGPTETTVWSTCFNIHSSQDPIYIGHPIANTRCWILDENKQLLAPGVLGELYIGGDGVAAGYLGQEELTQEKFSSNKNDQGVIYQTGDKARWTAFGELEYDSRIDKQTKIRGFRIEMGEVETALANFPGIAQVVAMVREDNPGDQRLCAYYMVKDDDHADFNPSQLRKYLRSILPNYMIPQLFLECKSFPMTPNGKIDNKQLPAPINTTAISTPQPLTPSESLIANIWQELLGINNVRSSDNFFDLGGHSMLSIKCIMQIEKETGVEIPAREIILSSLKSIANIIDDEKINPSTDNNTIKLDTLSSVDEVLTHIVDSDNTERWKRIKNIFIK